MTCARGAALVILVVCNATPPASGSATLSLGWNQIDVHDSAARQDDPPNAPRVQILSPNDDAYLSGPTLLRARVDPPGAASSIVFYVDGRQVCELMKLPFECDWDAGPIIAEHQ